MIKHLLLLCCAALPALAQDSLAIIVNPATGQENFTLPELQKVFRAEKAKADDGKKFVVVDGSPMPKEQYQQRLGIGPYSKDK